MKYFISIPAILVSTLIILFGICEIILRLTLPFDYQASIPDEFRALRLTLKDDGLWMFNDYNSNIYAFRNGGRVVTNNPLIIDSRLLVLGNSTMVGIFVDNEHTASSYLQRNLNQGGYHIQVFNQAIPGMSVAGEFQKLKDWNYRPGDIVVFVDGIAEEKASLNCDDNDSQVQFMTFYELCNLANLLPRVNENAVISQYDKTLENIYAYCQKARIVCVHIQQPRYYYDGAFFSQLKDKAIILPKSDFPDYYHLNLDGERDFSEFLYSKITQSLEF